MKTKKVLLGVFFVSMTNIAMGQIRFYHRIKMSTLQHYGFNLVSVTGGTSTPVDLCTMRKGVVSVSNGNINVDVWQIPDNITCPNGITALTPITVLRIVDGRTTYGLPTRVLWLPYRTYTLGVNTLPFRYRFPIKVNDSTEIAGVGTSSFQLGFNIGYTLGWSAITSRVLNNYSATLGAYIGPATTDLKKNVYKDQAKYIADQTNATLTYGLNLILARNSLGLVFALGSEKALGKNADQWIYNGELYFAFGINTGFGR